MTENRIKIINDCHKKREDRINLTVPKGEREIIQNHAAGHDKSTNEFIRRAINETRERDLENDSFEQLFREHVAEHPPSMPIEDFEKYMREQKRIEEALEVLETKVPEIRKFYESCIANQELRKKYPGNQKRLINLARQNQDTKQR